MLTHLYYATRLVLVVLIGLQISGCGSPEDRAKSYYDEGMKLFAARDNAKAMIQFKNAVKLKKDYLAAWLALAKIEDLNRNWAAEAPYLQTVIELDPKDVDSRMKLARLLLLTDATDEALNAVNAANDLDNHNADALALKAMILWRRNDPTAALANAQAALKLDPKNSGALSVVAADQLSHGATTAALQILDKVEPDAEGKDLGVVLFKLKILQQTQDWSKAEALLKRLAEQYPDGGFRGQLVELYLFEKRPDDAEKELRAIVAAKPADPQPEFALVHLLNTFKGPVVARQELVNRINTGKPGADVFPYQIALALFDLSQSNFKDSEQLLKSLIANSSPENTLAAQVTLAGMYLSRKQLDAAGTLVSDILQKDSRNTSGLALRASIRMERREFEPAISDLRTALNDQPRSTELMLQLGAAYETSGSIELADKQIADAMRASNFNPVIGLDYVAFLQRRGSNARAEEVLNDFATRWPENKQVLAKLAELKLMRQDWTGAEDVAARIQRIGDVGLADEILGTALVAQNKYDQGITALQNAYTATPSAVQPMLALVRAYVQAKQVDKAVALLQKVLKTDPANAEAFVELGSIQQANNAPDQAINNFKSAIEQQPKSSIGYRALARFYIDHNDLGKAQEVIRAGLTQQPDSVVLHQLWAETLELTDDYDGAIKEYESVLNKDPSSLVAANNLASLLADYRTDKASLERAALLAASLQKSPVPQFKDTLGWIDYQKGDYQNAAALLEQAAAALPNRALIHYHLGMTYIAAAQLAKASEQLNMALKQAPPDDLKQKIQAALAKSGP
jgi:tetratricopeptide (TPR) repeat protein